MCLPDFHLIFVICANILVTRAQDLSLLHALIIIFKNCYIQNKIHELLMLNTFLRTTMNIFN